MCPPGGNVHVHSAGVATLVHVAWSAFWSQVRQWAAGHWQRRSAADPNPAQKLPLHHCAISINEVETCGLCNTLYKCTREIFPRKYKLTHSCLPCEEPALQAEANSVLAARLVLS